MNEELPAWLWELKKTKTKQAIRLTRQHFMHEVFQHRGLRMKKNTTGFMEAMQQPKKFSDSHRAVLLPTFYLKAIGKKQTKQTWTGLK